jgi:hypothetical protein
MRAKFSFLKPFKLYKNLSIVFETRQKKEENSCIIFSQTKEGTFDIINKRIFNPQYIRCFYLEKFLDKTIFRKLINTNRIDVYKELKTNSYLTILPIQRGILKNKNCFYPLWPELSRMFTVPGAINKMNNQKNLVRILSSSLALIPSALYKENYVIVDASIFGNDFGDTESEWIKGLTVGSVFYLHMRNVINMKAYDDWAFKGRRVLLADTKSGLYFPIPESIEKLSLGKLRWMLNILHKSIIGQALSEEDLTDEGDIQSVVAPGKKAYAVFETGEDKLQLKAEVVFRSQGDAFSAFVAANYPEADAIIEDNIAHITESKESAHLLGALKSKKIRLYISTNNLSDERIFKKIRGSFKLNKAEEFSMSRVLAIDEKSEPLGLKFILEAPEETEEVSRAKVVVLKEVDGLKNSIPLSSDQREMVSSINDRVEEILTDKKTDATIDIANDAQIVDLKRRLTASRLLDVQNKKSAEVVDVLAKKQESASIIINGEDIKLREKLESLKATALEPVVFPSDSRNTEINKSSLKSIRKSYLDDLYEYDQYRIFTQFSDSKDIPIFVESIERTDTSSALTAKDTLTIKFNIAGERPKSMTIDVPRVDSDGFLYLQGSRKQITNQITVMPIAKIMQKGELVVQYTTSYNKIYLSRSNGNFSRAVAGALKAFQKMNDDGKIFGTGYNVLLGSSLASNEGFLTSLEYLEFCKKLVSFKVGKTIVSFSQSNVIKEFNIAGIDPKSFEDKISSKEFFPIGVANGKVPLYAGMTEGVYEVHEDGDLIQVAATIVEYLNMLGDTVEGVKKYLTESSYTGKNLVYTKLEVSNAYIPLVVFLSFKEGLELLFDRYDVKYEFVPSDSKKLIEVTKGFTEKVNFKDGVLWYKPGEVKKDLLFNGIYQLPTEDFLFKDFEADGEGFYQFFIDKVTPRYGKALQNFYTLFIDPITSDILKDNDIPSDIVGSFLYCNDLLQDASFLEKFDMNLYRIRNIESINAMLYKLVARQIEKYRRGSRGDTAGLLSVRSDALLLELNGSPIVEDATLLDPIKESENLSKAVYKGPGAPGFQHAQGTQDIRFFDKSMKGIFGVGSSFDANSGMNRRLTMNALIGSKRGYVKANEDTRNLDATNLYSIGELTASFSTRHSDPPRMMMTVGQSGHQIPTVDMNTALVSSGAFKVLPHFISNEFVFKAAEDGEVEAIDPRLSIMHLKYKDGTHGIVDLGVKHRRSPDGFFITIEQESKFKPGHKFKKDDIIAADKHFFVPNGNRTEMKKGTLCKIAAIGRDMTIEDSSCISEGLSKRLRSTIVMETSLNLSRTTNIIKLAKIGDMIKTSEPLAVFEENLSDASISEALSKMDGLKDALAASASNIKTSKFTGKIVDIELYYSLDISEYSKSLQSLIRSYIKAHTYRSDELSKGVRKDQFIEKRELLPLKNGRAKGVPFDGILLSFFVEIEEDFSVGDKLTFDTALKSVVGEVMPNGTAPTSEHRPEIPVDACLSPLSILNRKVPDFFFLMYTNKVLVELKEAIRDIVNKK